MKLSSFYKGIFSFYYFKISFLDDVIRPLLRQWGRVKWKMCISEKCIFLYIVPSDFFLEKTCAIAQILKSMPTSYCTWTVELISDAKPPVKGASWLISSRPVLITDWKRKGKPNVEQNTYFQVYDSSFDWVIK